MRNGDFLKPTDTCAVRSKKRKGHQTMVEKQSGEKRMKAMLKVSQCTISHYTTKP
jgi:hypothetical protein